MSFTSNPERMLSRRALLILALAVLLVDGVYLFSSWLTYRIGFPLDDAWIHQTYARNLALHGEWAFFPGQPSAGSTSPLWSAILSIGFLLHLSPYIWTYSIGALILFALSVLGEWVALRIAPAYRGKFPWVGLFFVLEWHLTWASVSGMETLLHALIITLVLALLMLTQDRYDLIGLLIGLSVWVRPDGLTLLAPALLTLALGRLSWRTKIIQLMLLVFSFCILFVPYLIFNFNHAGSMWPNTFYAKQAEYAILLQVPLWRRWLELAIQPLIGPGLLLVPGVLICAVGAFRQRNRGLLAGSLWLIGYLGLYALRLPVSYQHGRYLIPAMPIFFLWGLLGLIEFKSRRFLRNAWQWTVALMCAGFVWIGAQAYGGDVAFIESEMVDTARWVAEHIPASDLIAAHDIGALGYFGGHTLLDLAGLVSPEVIPFLRDEAQLADMMEARGVSYLIAFPTWYPALSERGEQIFVTGALFAPAQGGENMVIYRWPR